MTQENPPEPDSILEETLDLLKNELPGGVTGITLEKVVVGVFFTGVKLSSGYGGICYTPVDPEMNG